MGTTEHSINDALAEVLRGYRVAWRQPKVVESENTGTLLGSAGRPDILVVEANVSPVAIETEVLPAPTVEADALSRIGQTLSATGRQIFAAIAVRIEPSMRKHSGSALVKALRELRTFEYCLITGGKGVSPVRWPSSGWLIGGASDIALIAQSAATPPSVIDEAADHLVAGVSKASTILDAISLSHADSTAKIAKELKQEDGTQTRRMACTILANAFVFHESLAGGGGGLAKIKGLAELQGGIGLTRSSILTEWRGILKVNYWPIFDVARRILEAVPAASSADLVECLAKTAQDLLESNLMRSHDLTGAVFQRLIADRKFLAAYYTTPASAALLAGLAIREQATPAGSAWSNQAELAKLKVADFACGTGTLLSTAYQRIGQLFELSGGDAGQIHARMMSESLVGCDVLPAAAHLTASMLAGAQPGRKFAGCLVMTVEYGIQNDGGASLGSLDLLEPQAKIAGLAPAGKAAAGKGEVSVATWIAVAHASFDLILMNPPFTRPTGHEGSKIGVPNPMFAAFSASPKEQRVMAREAKRLTRGTAYHGNAGEASAFLVLADRKLKHGGVLGLVLPLSFLVGEAWSDSRKLVRKGYGDLVFVTIAGAKDSELSFSADTSMGECLVVAQKGAGPSTRATFAVLSERPAYPLIGWAIAKRVRDLVDSAKLRTLEEGPVGGTPINFGGTKVGEIISAPIASDDGWNLARVADLSIAQSAYQLEKLHRAWLPGMSLAASATVPISTVGVIGKIGPYHMDINGDTSDGGVRGPFELVTIQNPSTATFPILWAHETSRERAIQFEADSEGVMRAWKDPQAEATIRRRAADLVSSASHCHFSRDFRFNSQALSMQFTERPTIGGRAWLSVQLSSIDLEKALVLWSNSTLGLLLHWWHANKQQAGRGSIGKVSLASLPTLDVSALTPSQVQLACVVFGEFSGVSLKPMHLMHVDEARAELDRRILKDVLGFDAYYFTLHGPLQLLREKLAAEPSVKGAK